MSELYRCYTGLKVGAHSLESKSFLVFRFASTFAHCRCALMFLPLAPSARSPRLQVEVSCQQFHRHHFYDGGQWDKLAARLSGGAASGSLYTSMALTIVCVCVTDNYGLIFQPFLFPFVSVKSWTGVKHFWGQCTIFAQDTCLTVWSTFQSRFFPSVLKLWYNKVPHGLIQDPLKVI